MKRIKEFVSVVLSVNIIILSSFMINVSAASTGNIGVNETNITWSFDESTGILTVNGSGRMKSLNSSNGFSGKAKFIEQVVVTGDVENIGSYAFGACYSLVSIFIPESIIEIESNAFLYCENLKNVYYEGTKTQWDKVKVEFEGNGCLLNATINYKKDPHICSFDTVVNTIQPTCVTEGVETRKCSCGNQKTATIPATGVHNFEWNVSIEATCTTDGEEKQHCTVCNVLGETRKVNKSGHKTGEWVEEHQPTCAEDGLKVKKCESCGEILEQETIAPTGHNFGAWKTTIKETEDYNGEEKRTCKTCNLVETREIDNIQSNDENMLGDADDDGKVSAKDARLVLQVVAELKEDKELNYTNADVNKDKYITAVDARIILQFVAGLK